MKDGDSGDWWVDRKLWSDNFVILWDYGSLWLVIDSSKGKQIMSADNNFWFCFSAGEFFIDICLIIINSIVHHEFTIHLLFLCYLAVGW